MRRLGGTLTTCFCGTVLLAAALPAPLRAQAASTDEKPALDVVEVIERQLAFDSRGVPRTVQETVWRLKLKAGWLFTNNVQSLGQPGFPNLFNWKELPLSPGEVTELQEKLGKLAPATLPKRFEITPSGRPPLPDLHQFILKAGKHQTILHTVAPRGPGESVEANLQRGAPPVPKAQEKELEHFREACVLITGFIDGKFTLPKRMKKSK